MKVWVLQYDHKHGSDISVFASQEAAEDSAIQIADQWWDSEIGESIKRPKDPAAMAAKYWDIMSDRAREWHTITEHEVIE